ncbi:HAMP domain-containing histidine kinase [Paenibacillus alba]|uniref:sensor histidine kinase n=1 Tax=Paenibacillus alba TaxID=1197127 RepID=UPI001567A6C1|nr:HAMP domain-containing sensor histidine kinase [Paenibacillus alba]NQX66983.1 HAMP domain-containing histidine kinase [Paenibacillus alba]
MWLTLVRKRALLTALFTAVACSLLILSFTTWIQLQANQNYKLQQTIQTETFLSSYYELYGNWENVIDKLLVSKLLQDSDLQIWSSTNQPLRPHKTPDHGSYETASRNADGSQRHVLLLNGQVIGTYEGSFGKDVATVPYLILFSFIIGLILFIIMYNIILKKEIGHRQSLKRVLTQLAFLEPPQSENSLDSYSDMEQVVETEINKIAQRLYLLETIRKSMVADIAHELRTPLAVMRAKLDNTLCNQIPLELPQASLLQDEIYRMSKLLGDLQQLALAESGHLILNKTWFSLRSVLEGLTVLLAMDSEESGITVSLHCKDAIRVYADENRLRQVFINIIGNSLRYARSMVSITVSFESSICIVTVTDDGVGIEQEEIPYLFERFYRGTVNRREVPVGSSSGLGLGLPIAKQLMEIHRGTIDVTSRWQEGTTFQIKFPIFYEATAT